MRIFDRQLNETEGQAAEAAARAAGDRHLGIRRIRRHICLAADDLVDAARWLRATPRVWHQASSVKPAGERWDFGIGYEGALALAARGWSEGARDLAERLSVQPWAGCRAVRHQSHDIAGDWPDVPVFPRR